MYLVVLRVELLVNRFRKDRSLVPLLHASPQSQRKSNARRKKSAWRTRIRLISSIQSSSVSDDIGPVPTSASIAPSRSCEDNDDAFSCRLAGSEGGEEWQQRTLSFFARRLASSALGFLLSSGCAAAAAATGRPPLPFRGGEACHTRIANSACVRLERSEADDGNAPDRP